MIKGIVFSLLICLTVAGIAQQDQTIKSIPTKSASFYHPLFDNKLVSGQWIGEVYSPTGLELKLTNGNGVFVVFDPKNNDILLRFKGNTLNGIWDGYIYYLEKSKRGNLFIEGHFKNGLPHGKIISKFTNGQYFAGNFQYGMSYDKISLIKNSTPMSTYCNGFDFMQFLKDDTLQLQKCVRETSLDDPLYGAAIIMSNIALIADKHANIERFLECTQLNEVEIFIKNPDFAIAGAEAIKAVMKDPLWKDNSLEEIQFQLKQALIELQVENLSTSIEFISFLSCLTEESRKW